jgi:dTDP-4-dehydrorhamnose 3,5-epimerase
MRVEHTPLKDCFIVHEKVNGDARGYFIETYNSRDFKAATGLDIEFVQDNQSRSSKGVLRGLHMQRGAAAQAKLVRVLEGSVLDVAVDLRKGSPSFGQHHAIELTADNNKQFYVPAGFAHGFETLADNTIFQYKCTNLYNKASEGGILWNDPDLNIKWQTNTPIISTKDQELPTFHTFVSPF